MPTQRAARKRNTQPTKAPASRLHQMLIECENQLGWVPAAPTWKTRRTYIGKIRQMLATGGKREEDLAVALSYCRSRRVPINDPLELFAYIAKARSYAVTPAAVLDIDTAQQQAIAWEMGRQDDPDSDRWLDRLLRSVATGLDATLAEWRAAGRGI